MNKGYTIVELLIIVTIIGILITFGFSSFVKSQDRQTVQQAKEELLSKLQTYQKAAYAGDKACGGALLDIKVTFTATSMTATAECSGSPATAVYDTVNFSNLTFTTFPTIYFRPLIQGTTTATTNIEYTISNTKYRIAIEQPGIIKYVGIIP